MPDDAVQSVRAEQVRQRWGNGAVVHRLRNMLTATVRSCDEAWLPLAHAPQAVALFQQWACERSRTIKVQPSTCAELPGCMPAAGAVPLLCDETMGSESDAATAWAASWAEQQERPWGPAPLLLAEVTGSATSRAARPQRHKV